MRGKPAVLFCAVFGLYWFTLAPSLTWADGARMQLDVMLGGSTYWYMEEFQGLVRSDGMPFDRLGVAAWDHPLYVMLGQALRALPWGDPLYRINLFSALAGALTIVVVYEIAVQQVGNWRAAALGALALALSHTFWFHATTAEVYTLELLFMSVLILLALRLPFHRSGRARAAFAFLAGLGMANHLLLALTVGVSALYLILMAGTRGEGSARNLRNLLSLARYRDMANGVGGWRGVVLLGALFLAGFAPWWIQFIRMAHTIGFSTTVQVALAMPWLASEWGARSWWVLAANALSYAGWFVYQFLPLGVALGVYGFWRMLRTEPHVVLYLLALVLIYATFSANYLVADQFAMHLPSYLPFALAIPSGIDGLVRWSETRAPGRKWVQTGLLAILLAAILATAGVYALAPAALRAAGWTEERLGIEPIGAGARDTLAYFLNPNHRGDDSAYVFGRTTLEHLMPKALVFAPITSDQEAFIVLRYFQLAEGLRQDVHVDLMIFDPAESIPEGIMERTRSRQGCQPLYAASLNPVTFPITRLREEFDIVPESNLYRLLPRGPGRSAPCPDSPKPDGAATPELLIRRGMRRR